jgi:hypothetical protein
VGGDFWGDGARDGVGIGLDGITVVLGIGLGFGFGVGIGVGLGIGGFNLMFKTRCNLCRMRAFLRRRRMNSIDVSACCVGNDVMEGRDCTLECRNEVVGLYVGGHGG